MAIRVVMAKFGARSLITALLALLISSPLPALGNQETASRRSQVSETEPPATEAIGFEAQDEAPDAPCDSQPGDTELHIASDKSSKVELNCHATINVAHDTISSTIQSLIKTAVARDPNMDKLDHAFARYKSKKEKVAAQISNAINWTILSRGDNPSSEAGDVILAEKLKLKSRGSAEYARQKEIDEIHLRVVTAVTDICMGLGMTERNRSQECIARGTDSLAKLVGEDTANKFAIELRQSAANLNVPESAYSQDVWGAQEHQTRCNFALDAALRTDPLVMEIKRLVNKYNHHSKLYLVTSRVMKVGLSITGMSPTMVAPASQIALLAYVMATGGPEEDKLMNELYLSKRLDSRFQLLNSKVQLAVEKHQLARLTHNPMLLACSQSILRSMTSDAVAQKVLSGEIDDNKINSSITVISK